MKLEQKRSNTFIRFILAFCDTVVLEIRVDQSSVEGMRYAKWQVARLGRHSNGGKVELRDTLGKKLVDLSLCVCSLSLIDAQKTVPVPIRG
jgi:hypothetical protein